jgi:DnaJ-class molecular chaperone
MSRPDETDDLLPAGVARQQVDAMAALYGASPRYRGPSATRTCLTCMGKGTMPCSNREQPRVCRECEGTGRVSR